MMILKLIATCLFLAPAFASAFHKSNYPADSVPPPEVYTYLTEDWIRVKYFLFHNIRRNFVLFKENEQRRIEEFGWKPPAFSLTYKADGTMVPIPGTAGEDFLFTIIRMIEKVNDIAQKAGSVWRVNGWDACPDPLEVNSAWPVPPLPEELLNNTKFAEYETYKTDDFYNDIIVPAQAFLNDDDNLRDLTLGELGVKIEHGLFTYFLKRFSGYNPIAYTLEDAIQFEFTHDDQGRWDVDFDFLGEFYSAHLNPTFWKIAGWIEKQVQKWKIANAITEITWISTWQGGPTETNGYFYNNYQEVYNNVMEIFYYPIWRPKEKDYSVFRIVALGVSALALILSVVLCGYTCILKCTNKSFK